MPNKQNRTGRSTGTARHVRLYHWLLETEAWKSLDSTARAIYVEMASRYAGVGSNNGRIPYSIRDAARSLHIGKTTAARALADLQHRGFIVTVKKGGFSYKEKHATEWRLTEFPCDIKNTLATKDFACWRNKSQYPLQDHPVPETGQTGP